MNTTLIKIFNLFLLLASAMTVAHAEYTYASAKSDKVNITQHIIVDSYSLNYSGKLSAADTENETSDVDSLTVGPELETRSFHSCTLQSALRLAHVQLKFYHPQSRAPPVTP